MHPHGDSRKTAGAEIPVILICREAPPSPAQPSPHASLWQPHLFEFGIPGPVGLVPKSRGLVHWRSLINPPVQRVEKSDQFLNGLLRQSRGGQANSDQWPQARATEGSPNCCWKMTPRHGANWHLPCRPRFFPTMLHMKKRSGKHSELYRKGPAPGERDRCGFGTWVV